jgi:AraC-like DNA-binding protein
MVLAARELGLSVRSLRRHLEDEGASFRELTQAALHDAACSMLRNPAITLQSIAHALGFSDSSAFHRAFRRWSALTPAEYRSKFLSDDSVVSDARC